jgi:hypothetical protein
LGETGLPEGFPGEVRVPQFPAALPKRLGSFPFWRGRERFLDAMVDIYAHASIGGLNVVIGEAPAKVPDKARLLRRPSSQ